MFYRYEVRIGSDKPWEGCFQYFFPDQRRYIGRFLKEPKWYKEHPNVATRCWFTQEGFDKYGDLVKEAIEKRDVEYRLVRSESLENIVMLGKIQCIQRINMYDLKIPLEMRAQILIERNRLRKEVEKEHITQNQAERFLAEYMLRELHVISGKEAADKQVLSFINDFREDDKSIRQKFCAGYCYYFVVMLKDAFHRGEICWCAPLGHITVSPEGYINLTESGKEIATQIYERHVLLSSWVERLGVDPDIAAQDACRIEHVISSESFEALKKHIK